MSNVLDGLEPLSEDQKAHFVKVLEEAKRTMDQQRGDAKTAPYRNFIAGAVASGFSKDQAEFLWNNRPMSEWRC